MTGCGQRGAGSVRDVRVGGGSSEDGCGERPARAGAAGFRRPARLLLLALAALAIAGTPQAQAQTDIWSATLAVEEFSETFGYAEFAGVGSLSPTTSFTLGSTTYEVESLLDFGSGLSFTTVPPLSAAVASGLTLNVGSIVGRRSLRFADASFSSFSGASWDLSSGLGWSVGDTVPVSITQASDRPTADRPSPCPTARTGGACSPRPIGMALRATARIWLVFDVAQSFTTGLCEGGYELKSVMVRFSGGGWRYPLELTLHEDSTGVPGDKIADFRNPGMGTFRQTVSVQNPDADARYPETFALQEGERIYAGFDQARNASIDLEPDTTYFLALHSTVTASLDWDGDKYARYWEGATESPKVSLTSSDDESATLNDHEWSIGDGVSIGPEGYFRGPHG